MKALILTNGDYGDYSFCEGTKDYDLIICADGGMKHARRLQIIPDWIIGDFDSCNKEDFDFFKSQLCKIIQKPTTKDETDTELALDLAIEKQVAYIDIYGGVGTRFDHSFGNVQLIYKAMKQGVEVVLWSGHNVIRLVKSQVRLSGRQDSLVSLMPFSEQVGGITTTGLAYELIDATLQWGDVVGVSNYMLQDKAIISIKKGLLLVIQSKD